MAQQLHLSLIIPAYKQEKTIKRDLDRIKDVMDRLAVSYEIIVVVDGEIDNTMNEAKKIRSPKIHVTGYRHNHGKGYAVRYGIAQAKGEIIGFLDSGMDINPKGIEQFLRDFERYHADIVIGSKLHPDSKVSYPWQRRIISLGYRLVVKMLFGLSIRDTQVGMKFYKRKVLENVLPRLLVKAYAFDIELLAVAYRLGYQKIYEAPIELDLDFRKSTITSKNFWKIILLTLWDTLAVFYRMKILKYYDDGNKRKWRYDPELNFRVNVG